MNYSHFSPPECGGEATSPGTEETQTGSLQGGVPTGGLDVEKPVSPSSSPCPPKREPVNCIQCCFHNKLQEYKTLNSLLLPIFMTIL